MITETEMQHHCVWSYADLISKDKSAIYSYVDYDGKFSESHEPKRYTIEFKYTKNHFYRVEQVQGQYDKVNANLLYDFLDQFLADVKAAK